MNEQIYFQTKELGCYSALGRQGGRQVLNIHNAKSGKGCFTNGTIIHEFIHALGFHHMQSASDRDDYIEIIWENIENGKERNFAKTNNSDVTDFGFPYDYHSVMHYSAKAFSVNGNETIVSLDPEHAEFGQRYEMSKYDGERIRAMYNCD